MPEPVVELDHVTVQFGSHVALNDLSLQVPAGQRIALVGPSGAGKTTLLRLCTASVTPSAGSVQILGTDVTAASPAALRSLRSRVASVHQQLHLVGPLRVVHNVNAGRLGRWSTIKALRSLAAPTDVDPAREALASVGIEHKLLERTDRLSGGEQQRVAIARALLQDPELLLADEPVSSVDPARGEEVMDLIASVTGDRQRTLIVSLHGFDLARRRCDRVVGIRDGRVVFDLPAASVTDEMGADLYRTRNS